jgi:hypothetical protein
MCKTMEVLLLPCVQQAGAGEAAAQGAAPATRGPRGSLKLGEGKGRSRGLQGRAHRWMGRPESERGVPAEQGQRWPTRPQAATAHR